MIVRATETIIIHGEGPCPTGALYTTTESSPPSHDEDPDGRRVGLLNGLDLVLRLRRASWSPSPAHFEWKKQPQPQHPILSFTIFNNHTKQTHTLSHYFSHKFQDNFAIHMIMHYHPAVLFLGGFVASHSSFALFYYFAVLLWYNWATSAV